jgi:hypothetical protein
MAQAQSGPEIGLTLQLTNFLRAQETRPRTRNRTRFPGTQPKFPHQQIFHERNYRMHQQHWLIKLKHFLHTGPHFRILADETRRKITTSDGFYDPRQGTISMDHLTYGLTGMPGLLSKTDGRRTAKYSECNRLH